MTGARAQITHMRTSAVPATIVRAVRDASSILIFEVRQRVGDAELVDRLQQVVGEGGDGENAELCRAQRSGEHQQHDGLGALRNPGANR